MFFIVALLAALAGPPAVRAQVADLVVENAVIHTVDDRNPTARALAVKDGRLLAVGDSVTAHVGPRTRRIDAQGRTVIPGLIDSHVHLQGLGELLESLDLRAVKSIGAVAALVKEAAAKRPAGEWVHGRAWDQTNWGGEFPTAVELSAAAPDHPVFLRRVDGHAAWVNRKAMELAGLSAESKDPDGGKIIRDAQGRPTGVLVDRAMGLVARHIPKATDDQVRRRLERAAQACARLGLTSVHDAGIDAQTLAAYRTLLRDGKLPLRVYAMIGGPGPLWQQFLAKGPEVGEQLTIRSIKLYADGAMGSRGAAFFQPYADDPGNTGLLLTSKEAVEQVARDAVAKGFQVNTHAIGDRANRIVLDAYAAALGTDASRRFRVEHAQIVSLPDFELYRRHGIIASIQATHATSDMRWAARRLGPDRLAGAYAWQRFLKSGIRIANGSDFPVEDPNPLWGYYASVTRQDQQGEPEGGWLPDQRLTREQALHSWTLGGAVAAFEENEKGSLTPGKRADFVLLSSDILTAPPAEILTTQVLMTVLGGKVVHEAPHPP